MKKRLRIIIPLAVIVLALILWTLVLKRNGNNGNLYLSGNIDVTQVDLAFKISGHLARRMVDEGAPVVQGQHLATLDDTDVALQLKKALADADYAAAALAELEAGSRPEEVRRAEARVQQARFTVDELERGSRAQEIAEAEAALRQARADERTAHSRLILAEADYTRYAAVYKDGGVSRQAFETYRTGLDAAKNAATAAVSMRQAAEERLSLRREGNRKETISQARAALTQAEADLALVREGPRKEVIAQARARDAAARAGVAVARQRLADSRLSAPFDGVVLSTSAEPGSYLNPGSPVLTVADIRNAWLRAFVSESDLGRIRLGHTATITVDADPHRTWKGRISYISSAAEFTPRTVQSPEERTNLVYRIKIQLENADGVLKPGMPADAMVELDR